MRVCLLPALLNIVDANEETPIYWVSEPIGVGFFVKPLATERHGTRRAAAVTARNQDGEIVKVEKLG